MDSQMIFGAFSRNFYRNDLKMMRGFLSLKLLGSNVLRLAAIGRAVGAVYE
jgi:hypothetical protein